MKKFKYFLYFFLGISVIGACKSDVIAPLYKDGGAPDAISNLKVENLAGAAIVSYTLPTNENLLYVKAVYQINNKPFEVKSSQYKNSVLLEGFNQSKDYDVKLYAVSRSDELSTPVEIKVHPLEAPVVTVAKSISFAADFGGLTLNFENLTEANISINVITKDTLNQWVSADALYTKRKAGVFSVRGYAAVERTFGIFVKDRWGNKSDTTIAKLTPLFEVELDRNLYQAVILPSDASLIGSGYGIDHLWDNDFLGLYHAAVGSGIPEWGTLSLGQKATLSRIIYWQRDEGVLYNHANPKVFEIWGSNNPDPNGTFDGWTKLMTCTSLKPSGQPVGINTSEDVAYAKAGEEFLFPSGTPPVKYIRIKTLQTWGGVDFAHIAEMKFFGKPE